MRVRGAAERCVSLVVEGAVGDLEVADELFPREGGGLALCLWGGAGGGALTAQISR